MKKQATPVAPLGKYGFVGSLVQKFIDWSDKSYTLRSAGA